MTLQEFKEKTSLALEVTEKLLGVSQDPSMVKVKSQLEAIMGAIDKNEPSLDLANKLTMAQIIVSSYSPAPTSDIDRWGRLILEVNHIYKKWSHK
tara:strand:- start:15601 stop:15885 length:285 start_codon:yes stop_codon:yes gene_type:complete